MKLWKRDLSLPHLRQLVPGLAELRGYRRSRLCDDVVAGVTVAAVAIPSGLGMGELAGVGPVAGLYATAVPLIGYALFGSSRQMIVGPTGAIAAVTATSVAAVVSSDDPARVAGMAAALAALSGVILILASLLRLGFMAEFLSRPVLLGYINGVAVLIIAGQLDKLLGITVESRNFVPQVWETLLALPQAHGWTVLLSALLIGVVVLLRVTAPKIPAVIVAVVLAGAASAAIGFPRHGIEVVGDVPRGFPLPRLPGISLDDVLDLVVPALGLALLIFGDSMAIARTYADKHRYTISAGRELLGLGAANIAAGLFQAIPIDASGSRTALNDVRGGASPLVGMTVAATAVLVAAFATPLIEPLPTAALGVVIILATAELIKVRPILRLRRVHNVEMGLAVVTFVAVLFLNVMGGLAVAVLLSLGVFVYWTARPHDAVLGSSDDIDGFHDITAHQGLQPVPGLIVYRFDAPLYFANAPHMARRVRELLDDADGEVRWLMIDAEAMTYVDAKAIDTLKTLHQELAEQSVTLTMARVKAPIRSILENTGTTELLGPEHFFPTVRSGVQAFRERTAR
ncbi:SulP family inorganic anion transporter [Nonomuraea sp. NPDC050691]|uniref:SulP family inorganic anion transporter n=1 Tax=Nonomuraea sp. NPDC050691 TaxID=3155661 RepID=UPI0033D06781